MRNVCCKAILEESARRKQQLLAKHMQSTRRHAEKDRSGYVYFLGIGGLWTFSSFHSSEQIQHTQ